MAIERENVSPGDVPLQELNLFSIAKLESILGLKRDELESLASLAGSFYDPFVKTDRKRPFQKKFKPPKERKIDNPLDRLKDVQRRIGRSLLKPLDLPFYLCGGVKGRSVLDCVALHLGAKVIVTLDIRSFFPSVSNLQVYQVWSKLLNCSPRIAALLTTLTTFERHLPQGAPTSTFLANLVLYSVDAPIRRECELKRVVYTSWVDDLAFSGDCARDIINTAVSALNCASFAVAHKKLKIMGPGDRKVLCGVLAGRFPSVLPERIARLRSGIHKLRTNQVPEHELPKYLRSLEGSIKQLSIINPKKGKRLLLEMEAVRNQ